MKRGPIRTGADLVRPDEAPAPRRVPVALLIWIGVVLLVGTALLWPSLDHWAMRAPLQRLLDAGRRHDIAAMERQFTRDGLVGYQDFAFPAAVALKAAEPFLKRYAGEGNLRLTSVDAVRTLDRHRVRVEFTVAYTVSGGDDLPYRGVPVHKRGTAVLRRVGWFRWSIAHLTSEEPEFGEALQVLLLPMLLPGMGK